MKSKREKAFLSQSKIRLIFILDAVLAAFMALLLLMTARPSPVGELTVAESTYNTVALTWKESDNANGYKVFRSKDNKEYKYIGSTDDNEYIDEELRTGNTYYYVVSARNGVVQSKINKEDAIEVTPALDTPKVNVDTSKGNVKLNITEVDGAMSYEIIRDGEKIGQINERKYTDESADPDLKHIYEVRAVRYVKNPVYSEKSAFSEAELHSVPDFKIDVRGDTLHLEWGRSEYR